MKRLFAICFSFILLFAQSGFIKTPEQLYRSIIPKNPGAEELFGDKKNLPKHIDLSSQFPKPGHQGKVGSCASWAIAHACKSYQEALEHNWDVNSPFNQFSPSFIYNQVNKGVDKGSTIPQAFHLVMDKGCSTIETMPYTHDYLLQPSNMAFREAEQYKIQEFKRLQNGPGLLPSIKFSLNNGIPVIIAMTVYENFRHLKKEAYRTFSGEEYGGHGMCIVGYNDHDNTLKLINSWGNKWGEKGYCRIDYQLIDELFLEAYVCLDMIEQKEQILAFPKNVQASEASHANKVTVSWDAVNGAQSYEIYRADNKKEDLLHLKTVNINKYEDDDVLDKVKYLYAIKAKKGNSVSEFSEITCGWASKEELGIPGDVVGEYKQNQIHIRWLPVTQAEIYNIYRWEEKEEKYYLLGKSINTDFVDNVSMEYSHIDRHYYYVITALKDQEESAQSKMVFITIPAKEQKEVIPFAEGGSQDIVINKNDRKELKTDKEWQNFYDPNYMQAFFEAARKAEAEAFRKMKEAEENYYDEFKKYEEEMYKKFK